MTITINPVVTTNALGTFSVTLDGYVQGMAEDDPAMRYQLTGGQLAASETLPMFGGIPITEMIPPVNVMQEALQTLVARAAAPGANAGMTGISVFNQNHAMLNSPQSPVQAAGPGMLVNLYRFGTLARIPMAMDPAMALPPASPGLIISPTALFWNIANQWVTTTGPAGAGILAFPTTVKLLRYNIGNSMTVNYNSGTGFATWTRNGSCVLLQI